MILVDEGNDEDGVISCDGDGRINNMMLGDTTMPGGDISAQYMPTTAPPLLRLPSQPIMPVGTQYMPASAPVIPILRLSPASVPPLPLIPILRLPVPSAPPPVHPSIRPIIRLNLGRLFSKQAIPFRIPPAILPTVSTKIFTLAPGQTFSGLPQGVPQIGFEQREGLWVVSDGAVPVLTGILNTMTYTMDPVPLERAPGGLAIGDGETGSAAFTIGVTGNALNVIGSKVQAGLAALLDKSSIMTGVPKLMFTSSPSVVAARAGGDNATHALINGSEPKDVLDGALKIIHGGAVPSSVVDTTKTTTPWLMYGLIGAGVLGVGYLVFRKK